MTRIISRLRQKFQPSESSSRPFSLLQLTGQEDEVLCPAGVLRSLQELDLSPPLGRDASHRESKSRNISPQIFSQWWYKGSITTCAVDIVTFPPQRLQAREAAGPDWQWGQWWCLWRLDRGRPRILRGEEDELSSPEMEGEAECVVRLTSTSTSHSSLKVVGQQERRGAAFLREGSVFLRGTTSFKLSGPSPWNWTACLIRVNIKTVRTVFFKLWSFTWKILLRRNTSMISN